MLADSAARAAATRWRARPRWRRLRKCSGWTHRRAEKIGEKLRERAMQWQKKHPMVGDVRGLGAMMAVEFVKDRKTKEPAKEFNVGLIKRCVENGVILIYAGTHSNILRYLVPLVITDEQLDEGLDVIECQLAA